MGPIRLMKKCVIFQVLFLVCYLILILRIPKLFIIKKCTEVKAIKILQLIPFTSELFYMTKNLKIMAKKDVTQSCIYNWL